MSFLFVAVFVCHAILFKSLKKSTNPCKFTECHNGYHVRLGNHGAIHFCNVFIGRLATL